MQIPHYKDKGLQRQAKINPSIFKFYLFSKAGKAYQLRQRLDLARQILAADFRRFTLDPARPLNILWPGF